jgi:hypothetical protein
MPHQVVKASVHGSTGDLAKITDALQTVNTSVAGQKVNILSISAGEAAIPTSAGGMDEFGVVSMILDPDDDVTMANVKAKLTNLPLGGSRKVEHVDVYPIVHIELPDKPGELKKALDFVGARNILSVISMGSLVGSSHVALAFETDAIAHDVTHDLENNDVKVHGHQH